MVHWLSIDTMTKHYILSMSNSESTTVLRFVLNQYLNKSDGRRHFDWQQLIIQTSAPPVDYSILYTEHNIFCRIYKNVASCIICTFLYLLIQFDFSYVLPLSDGRPESVTKSLYAIR